MSGIARRSFLKGLAGVGGALVAGKFVLQDPQVLAGDLVVPNQEPVILKATKLPETINRGVTGILTRYDVHMYDRRDSRLSLEMHLTSFDDTELREAIGADEVSLYFVKRGRR